MGEQPACVAASTTTGSRPFFSAVVSEDVGDLAADHGAEAAIEQRPRRVLARRAAAEIAPADEDRAPRFSGWLSGKSARSGRLPRSASQGTGAGPDPSCVVVVRKRAGMIWSVSISSYGSTAVVERIWLIGSIVLSVQEFAGIGDAPLTAAAAAVNGLASIVRAPLPWRPSKLRLLVLTASCPWRPCRRSCRCTSSSRARATRHRRRGRPRPDPSASAGA